MNYQLCRVGVIPLLLRRDYWFAAADVSATHEKFAVLFVSPVPLYFATWGYGHNGRVLST